MFKYRGFTLVELVVVLAILSLLSAASIAAFVSYNRAQGVSVGGQEVRTILYTARSYALAQANTPQECYSGQCQCPSGQTFVGYRVVFCCASGGGQNCPNTCIVNDSAEHYELNLLCSSSSFTVETDHFPTGVSVSNASTSRSFSFEAVTGAVTGAGMLRIGNAFSQTNDITVSALGVIQ